MPYDIAGDIEEQTSRRLTASDVGALVTRHSNVAALVYTYTQSIYVYYCVLYYIYTADVCTYVDAPIPTACLV